MNDKEYQRLMDIAARKLERVRKFTKEEAIADLVNAGLLDPDGNISKKYPYLRRYMNSKK